MNDNHKIKELDSISRKGAVLVSRAVQLSRDRDDEVRYRSIECLENLGLRSALNAARSGLDDSDELVRIACLELLGELEDKISLARIARLIHDPEPLVRGAAAIAIAQMRGGRLSKHLRKRLLIEKGETRVAFYAALYLLGDEVYLKKLLNALRMANYRARCFAANLLVECATDKTRPMILGKLARALEKEKTVAAASSIKNAVAALNSAEKA